MHQQFSLSWSDIKVEVLEKRRTFWKTTITKKLILNNVSGTAKSCSLVAIMGVSGSGKTTFLSAVSGRLREKKGVIKINNTIISNDTIKNISGYVHQHDIFIETLTVLEHLRFVAALQIGHKTKEKRHMTIKRLLTELSLHPQSNVLIKHLSGGERRRLSLAGELFNDPYILFCDEPTTGLDSYSAITVIQKLQSIALSGKIVLATIHQPSSELFHYFNQIALLAEGKLIFQGSKEDAKIFFESFNLHCPSTYNPADFYIKCLVHEDISKMAEVFKNKNQESKEICHHCDHFDNISFESNYKNGFIHQLRWLMWRCFIDKKRNKKVHLSLYFSVMIELTLVSILFSYVQLSDSDSVQNIQGFLAFAGSELIFTNMYSVINVFPEEVVIFLREKTLYSTLPYFLSKIMSMIPLCLFSTVIYMSIFFLILKFLNGFNLWLTMTYLMFLISMASFSLGLSCSAHFSKVEHVDLIMGSFELILLLLSGFLVRLDTVSKLVSWIRYISPFYYSFDSISNLFWRDINDIGNCQKNETIPCYTNGIEVLQNYGVYKPYDAVFYDIIFLHVLVIAFCLIGYLGLLWKKKQSL